MGAPTTAFGFLEVGRRDLGKTEGRRTSCTFGAACTLRSPQAEVHGGPRRRCQGCGGTVCFWPQGLGEWQAASKVDFLGCESAMAATLLRGAYCTHAPGEHQVIEGSCRVDGQTMRRSELAAAWPTPLCDRILEAAEFSLRSRTVPPSVGSWSLAAEAGGHCWEAVPVSSAAFPEEELRQQMNQNAITGERYDYVTFDGEVAQQPRRLRAMVAHLHVTLGHLSNDRLARMFILSGAQNNVVELVRKLRSCQVCAMVRPPGPAPQVAYQKPKQFNERISGDSFYKLLGRRQQEVLGHALH